MAWVLRVTPLPWPKPTGTLIIRISYCSIVWSVKLPLQSLSDRLKNEVALCGELLELSLIHDVWEPTHDIPANGTCMFSISSYMENWNSMCDSVYI